MCIWSILTLLTVLLVNVVDGQSTTDVGACRQQERSPSRSCFNSPDDHVLFLLSDLSSRINVLEHLLHDQTVKDDVTVQDERTSKIKTMTEANQTKNMLDYIVKKIITSNLKGFSQVISYSHEEKNMTKNSVSEGTQFNRINIDLDLATEFVNSGIGEFKNYTLRDIIISNVMQTLIHNLFSTNKPEVFFNLYSSFLECCEQIIQKWMQTSSNFAMQLENIRNECNNCTSIFTSEIRQALIDKKDIILKCIMDQSNLLSNLITYFLKSFIGFEPRLNNGTNISNIVSVASRCCFTQLSEVENNLTSHLNFIKEMQSQVYGVNKRVQQDMNDINDSIEFKNTYVRQFLQEYSEVVDRLTLQLAALQNITLKNDNELEVQFRKSLEATHDKFSSALIQIQNQSKFSNLRIYDMIKNLSMDIFRISKYTKDHTEQLKLSTETVLHKDYVHGMEQNASLENYLNLSKEHTNRNLQSMREEYLQKLLNISTEINESNLKIEHMFLMADNNWIESFRNELWQNISLKLNQVAKQLSVQIENQVKNASEENRSYLMTWYIANVTPIKIVQVQHGNKISRIEKHLNNSELQLKFENNQSKFEYDTFKSILNSTVNKIAYIENKYSASMENLAELQNQSHQRISSSISLYVNDMINSKFDSLQTMILTNQSEFNDHANLKLFMIKENLESLNTSLARYISIEYDDLACNESCLNLGMCIRGRCRCWAGTQDSRCSTGFPVRLVNNKDAIKSAGRIEIFYNNSWGTVCDDGFDVNSATVACRSLNEKYNSGFTIGSKYGEGSGQIWLDEVTCLGSESNIGVCSHRPWGKSNCEHAEDISIQCESAMN